MYADDCCLANPIDHLGSMSGNICEGCHTPIDERVFLAVDNQLWHATCLHCDVCHNDLQWDQSCFLYKGRVFCRADYQSLFVCPGCDQRLSGGDLVFRLAQTTVYHCECLRCHSCGEVLHLGDTYALLGGRNVICAKHTTEPTTNFKAVPQICDGIEQPSAVKPTKRGARKVKKPTKRCSKKAQVNRIFSPSTACLQQHLPELQEVASCTEANEDLSAPAPDLPVENIKLFVPLAKADKSKEARSRGVATNGTIRSKKRIRTSFKHNQLQAMKAHFELNQNPDSKDLRQLSDETGLTKRVLQVWFQNARAKYRRWGSIAESLDADQSFTSSGQSDSSPDAATQCHNTSEPVFAPIRDIFPQNRASESLTSTMEGALFPDKLQEWQEQQTAPGDSANFRGRMHGVPADFQMTNLPIQITSLQNQVASVT